jgi:hypothetical protein
MPSPPPVEELLLAGPVEELLLAGPVEELLLVGPAPVTTAGPCADADPPVPPVPPSSSSTFSTMVHADQPTAKVTANKLDRTTRDRIREPPKSRLV